MSEKTSTRLNQKTLRIRCGTANLRKGLVTTFSLLIFCTAFAAEKAVAPANLFANGDLHDTKAWRTAFYVDPAPGRDRNAIVGQLKKVATKTFVKGENGHVYAKIVTPDDFPVKALNGFSTSFNLKEPLKQEHECCFTFRYRGTAKNPKISHFYAVVNYINGHKHFGNWGNYSIPLSKDWKVMSVRFKVAANTLTMSVNMGINGQGSCEFGDITLTLTPVAAKK